MFWRGRVGFTPLLGGDCAGFPPWERAACPKPGFFLVFSYCNDTTLGSPSRRLSGGEGFTPLLGGDSPWPRLAGLLLFRTHPFCHHPSWGPLDSSFQPSDPLRSLSFFACSVLIAFRDRFWSDFGSKNCPKINQKSMSVFDFVFWLIFYSKICFTS